jgi:hypothetical protein
MSIGIAVIILVFCVPLFILDIRAAAALAYEEQENDA